jgi:eukaryotic-like serine/threonine-protein kinase
MTESKSSDARIDGIIADYLKAVAAGSSPDRAALLAQHADLAEELKSFFADHDRMHRFVEPPTIGPAPVPSAPFGSVRYFGDYELLEEIARGGMGVVYKARQVSLNRVVALKMILAGQLASADDVRRFRTEAEAAANLDHPNILPIYEVGEHASQHYFSMKFVEGGTLSGWLKNRNADSAEKKPSPFSSAKSAKSAFQILIAVARAVHYAHQRGILHRDLKPGNILLDADGTPFVADFGLAKRIEGDATVTHSGALVGTPSYMAPEQARAEKQLTTAIDVYAIGAILYEALTGRPPFQGSNAIETVMQVLEREPDQPHRSNPGVDRDLATVAMKCLEKDPARRYESAAALADEMERWQRGEPIVARPVKARERVWKWTRRRPAIAGLIAALILTLVVGGALLTTSVNNTYHALASATQQLYVSRIFQTARELADENYSRADDLLKQAPAAQRGWEWHYLDRVCHRERAQLGPPLTYGCSQGIAASADGRVIALLSWHRDSRVVLLDGETLAERGRLGCPDGNLYLPDCIAVSGDGRIVVAGASRGGIAFWEVNGTLRHQIANVSVTRMALNDDGTILAVVGEDTTVRLWSTADGRPLRELGGLSARPAALAFRPGRAELVASSSRGCVVWDAATGAVRFPLGKEFKVGDADTSLGAVGYTPDGLQILVGDWHVVHRYDADTGATQPDLRIEIGTWAGKSDSVLGRSPHHVRHLAIRADGKYLLTAGMNDREPCLTELATGKLVGRLIGHSLSNSVTGVAFTCDGSTTLTSATDERLRAWEIPPPANPAVAVHHPTNVEALAYSNDGRWLATGDSDGDVRLTDVRTGKKVHTWSPLKQPVAELVFSSDDRWLTARFGPRPWNSTYTGPDCHLIVWDTTSGQIASEQNELNRPVTAITTHPSEPRIAVAGGGVIRELVLPSGTLRREFTVRSEDEGQESFSMVYHPDGRTLIATAELLPQTRFRIGPDGRTRIATVGSHNGVQAWDTETGHRVERYVDADEQNFSCSHVDVSRNGRILAALGSICRVWDARSGGLLQVIPQTGNGLAVSRDGSRLVTMGTPTDVWDTATGERVLSLPFGQVQAVAWHPDGHRLAVAAMSDVLVYDATPRQVPTDWRRPGRPWQVVDLIIRGGPVIIVAILAVAIVWLWRIVRPFWNWKRESVPPKSTLRHSM